MFSLDEKVALVTGAGSGIGAAIAETLAAAGALVIVTDSNPEAGAQTAAQIVAGGRKGRFVPLDVTQESACQTVVGEVLRENRHLDVLVNNAGIGAVGTLLQTTGEALDRLFAVNVRGVFNVSGAALPHMLE